MIIKPELEIIDVFRKHPLNEMTFNEIMNLSHKKSRSWAFNVLQKLVSYNALIKTEVNNSSLYKANLESPLLLSYFISLNFADSHISNNRDFPYGLVLELLRKVKEITPFFIMLIFGSYAERKHHKHSDIDIAFIVDNKEVEKRMQPYIENIGRRSIPRIDYSIILKDDFLNMLLRKEENLGKEIYKKRLIIWGNEQYYQLIKEAEGHGFKG